MKRSKQLLCLALSAALALTTLAGCAGGASSTASPASAPAGSTAAPDASTAPTAAKREDIVICMADDLESFDPIASSAIATMAVTKVLYTTLYIQDENKQPQLRLAESMEKISDTELVFKIRADAKFSDGTPITVEDVVFCLNRAYKSPMFTTLMQSVSAIEKMDEQNVRIRTTGPSPSILLALSHPGTAILPKSYVEKAEASKDWSKPITSGQYVLGSRQIGDSVVLLRNDNYFDAASAAMNKSLTFKFVPEASSRTVMVETGEADVNFAFATADYQNASNNPKLKLHAKPGTTVQYYGFDVTLAPFDNVKVRQAINYAIDREAVLTVVAEGLGVPAYSVLPPSCLGYLENPANYSYDVEKAKQLMKEAGQEKGFTTTICAFNDTGARVAEVLQMYLSEIGITVNISRYESSVRMDMIANHQVPTFAGQWGAMSDADMVLPRLFTKAAIGGMNFTYYTNEKLEPLFEKARQTFDPVERTKIYNECVTILAEEAAWCPLYIANNFALARAELQGVVLDGECLIDPNLLHYSNVA